MRFLLVDRIIALEPGRSVEAEKTLPATEELFLDHFPGFPVVPGVLLTEMLGQAAGKCLNVQHLPRGNAMLAEIRNARFRQWVRPGELITLHATITQNKETFAVAECHATVAGVKVCTAQLMLCFKPVEELAAGYRDEVLERFLSEQRARTEPVQS
jgi:3-hydroxyacyl-[acyl-carrier-protein] dehydratase